MDSSDNEEITFGFNCVGCSEKFQFMHEAQAHFLRVHKDLQISQTAVQTPSKNDESIDDCEVISLEDSDISGDDYDHEGKKKYSLPLLYNER